MPGPPMVVPMVTKPSALMVPASAMAAVMTMVISAAVLVPLAVPRSAPQPA